MATNTYVALATQTLGTAASSVTFSSISQSYTDLFLVFDGLASAGAANGFQVKVNGGGSVQTYTRLQGNGTSASSSRVSGGTGDAAVGVIGNTNRSTVIVNIMNYSNTTTYKTMLSRYNSNDSSDGRVGAYVNLTPSTSAVTSILIDLASLNNFAVGSTFSLYGIASEGAAYATGGYVTSDASYYYHTFRANGTFTPKQSLSCDILIVAGGGGSGGIIGGGGGAGGLRGLTNQSLSTTNYTISIGAGGVAGVGSGTYGTDGVTSTVTGSGFTTLASTGGGNGGGGSAPNANGRPGGSGAGGSYDGGGGTQTGGAGNLGGYSPVEGYAGASGGGSNLGGGGGGATATGSGVTAGNGSSVYSSWGLATSTGQNISGTYWYAGGGGGGTRSGYGSGGAGGNGGGGAGSTGQGNGTPGTANTGGGGGGAGYTSSLVDGSNGGSGIIIVRYAKQGRNKWLIMSYQNALNLTLRLPL